jgi:hypothetical protein
MTDMTPEEERAWAELERKQLNKKENKMKNKDIAFSHWYDSLEGTKSQGFAYKAWCAGWEAATKPIKCNCISPERCDLYDRCMKGEN